MPLRTHLVQQNPLCPPPGRLPAEALFVVADRLSASARLHPGSAWLTRPRTRTRSRSPSPWEAAPPRASRPPRRERYVWTPPPSPCRPDAVAAGSGSGAPPPLGARRHAVRTGDGRGGADGRGCAVCAAEAWGGSLCRARCAGCGAAVSWRRCRGRLERCCCGLAGQHSFSRFGGGTDFGCALQTLRWYKNVGLGFKTPKEAIEGNYVDKKCPFTSDVSIRGRIMVRVRAALRSAQDPSAIARDPASQGPRVVVWVGGGSVG